MIKTKFYQKLVLYILQFVTFLGTAAWVIYWLTMRVPMADWRFLAVGLLLAAVLGWWPLVSLGVVVVLSLSVAQFAADLDRDLKIQVIQEIAIFWALGLGWGVLARRWLAPPPMHAEPTYYSPPPVQVQMRVAEDSAFRSQKLMAGNFEETSPAPDRHPSPSKSVVPPPVPDGHAFPVFKPEQESSTPAPKPAAKPLPRPVTPAPPPPPSTPPTYFGEESVYLPSLPGLQSNDSTQVVFDVLTNPPPSDAPTMEFGQKDPTNHPGPLSSPPGAQTTELHLDQMPPRPRVMEEPSVAPAEEFPTMELPVNSLLRAAARPSHNPNSSFHVPIPSSHGSTSGQYSNPGSTDDASESDGQTIRRSSSFLRPETLPGTSYEHVLEWYNQFAWSPWTAEELEKRYYVPGAHIAWESLALADLAKTWKTWKLGPITPPTNPGQVTLGALEGFLRCETLGMLRQKGFPDLHVLSASNAGEIWVPVYHEVRGRMRGGEAVIHRADQGPLATDVNGLLIGRPDRLAEIREESDVVSLVTPFSVGEALNWTSVYAVAQMRVAENMGYSLSGVPVVINLPLPIWDERRQCRVIVVEDVATEQRRLDVVLERFHKVLSGIVQAKSQTQSSVCNGCGWRHACSSYAGGRPRLDLSKPPQQIAAALR